MAGAFTLEFTGEFDVLQTSSASIGVSAGVSVKATVLAAASVTRTGISVVSVSAMRLAPASARIAGTAGVAANAIVPSTQQAGSATIGVTAGVAVSASVLAQAAVAIGGASTVTEAATVRAAAAATVAGVSTIGVNATQAGKIQASASIGGVGSVAARASVLAVGSATIGGASGVNPFTGDWTTDFGSGVFLSQAVTVSAIRATFASARIAGTGGTNFNATVATLQPLATLQSTGQLGVNAGAKLMASARIAVAGRLRVDATVASSTINGVDVPTELEFDALSARVDALSTAGVTAVTFPGQPFYAVEITAARGGGAQAYLPTKGFATRPRGALGRRTQIAQSVTKLFVSDLGYRTAPMDPAGVVPYPPLVQTAFSLSRHINLDPTQSAIGAAWGSVVLANAGRQLDGLAASWNNDGRDLRILRGVKTFDADRGYFTDPPYASLLPVFVGLSTQWQLDETTLTVPIIDAAYWMARPYQNATYGGTGTYDGTDTLRGAPIPRTRGGSAQAPVANITPTLVDPLNRIYQYSDARGSVVHLYEAGAQVFGYAGDTTNLYSGAPASGFYRTDNSRGLFQLGTVPQGQITADVTGEFPIAGPITNAAEILYYMLTEDMSVPAVYLDQTSFGHYASSIGGSGINSDPVIARGFATAPRGALAKRTVVPAPSEAASGIAGIYFDSTGGGTTGLAAASAILASIGGHLIPTRAGVLRLFLLRAIDYGRRPVGTLDPSVLVRLVPQPLPTNLLPQPYRFRVAYLHNYTVQQTGLSPSASNGQLQFAGTADRYATWISPSIQASNLRPNDPNPVGVALLEHDDAQSVANAWGALWGARRRLYSAEMPLALALQYEMGDVARVTYPMDDLSAGRLGQIVGEDFSSSASTATLQVLV